MKSCHVEELQTSEQDELSPARSTPDTHRETTTHTHTKHTHLLVVPGDLIHLRVALLVTLVVPLARRVFVGLGLI